MKIKNRELLSNYKGKRGTVASEMCRRSGTIKYLLKYCTDNDTKFHSCMKDTIDVLSKKPERNY